MKRYNPKEIEPKWQKSWDENKLYTAVDFDPRPKYVMLTEFPYPSGDGLHLGHVREYTLGDIMARRKRMGGYNVLYPMGYDAFGLPTENYAIKNKITPQAATDQNVGNFQKQFESLGFSFDWDRSFRTSDPSYYKWTQWLFLQFLKAGLAYQDEIAINWCPKCKTGLANEEVVNGRHERCDTIVEKKLLKQWILKITKYADKLIDGLQNVDYPSRIADQQVNWIGRSVGAEIDFAINSLDEKLTVFTTRPDTIFGATYMVIAPEHPLASSLISPEQSEEAESYIQAAGAKSEIERMDTDRSKSGVFSGTYAINPATKEEIPIWIADYVLAGYGTGAIMAVPAHDQRDYEFAKKFDLPIKPVVALKFASATNPPKPNLESVDRRIVQCIVKHPDEEKYLAMERTGWGDGSFSFVTGGIEADESVQEAATREILEETGFTDIKSMHSTDEVYSVEFYHGLKKENRLAEVYSVIVQLGSLEHQEITAGEASINKPHWLSLEELRKKFPDRGNQRDIDLLESKREAFSDEGVLVNSGSYDKMASSDAREAMTKAFGRERVQYRLRDWIFSRQHYWGEPIPVIHCADCGIVPVPDDQLPVELPPVDNYEPTDTGESPLAEIESWVNVDCPKCGKPAKRETDTMPNWAGSSWYYLRYFDAHNDQCFADPKKLEYWGAVDMYLGGMEHTTLHLLYSRFWHQFFYEQGLVPTPEPYAARRGQGIVLAEDGAKMSKSKGNVINPNDIIDQGYGADAVRLAIAFLAPFDQTTPWNTNGVPGTYRFLQRAWTVTQEFIASTGSEGGEHAELMHAAHKAIKKVSADLDNMQFNTAIAALMEYVNELYKIKAQDGFDAQESWKFAVISLVKLIAPFAPHIADELWSDLGHAGSVHVSDWAVHDDKCLIQNEMTIVVQINGKLRATIKLSREASEQEVIAAATADPKISEHLYQKEVRRSIYIPHKLLNFVV